MSEKSIFLMGAPLPDSLDWENDELLNAPIPPFRDTQASSEEPPLPSQTSARWRVLQPLPIDEQHDHHVFYYGPEDPDFLTTHQLVAADEKSTMQENSILSQFYDHSFTVHEATEVSISELRDEDLTEESATGSESIDEPSVHSSAERIVAESPPSLRIPGKLRDLQDIPIARYLQSIAPQTVTVSLVVGVIAIHPPRRVVTRQWKTELDIIELVVGDETRAGFAVNFWLPSDKTGAAKTMETDRLRQSLGALRPQDIVLLRTIGLSSFRDQVYGQSLRGGMTQVDLLYRRPLDMTDAGGFYQVLPPSSVHDDVRLQKVHRVREWVLRFVGATHEAGGDFSGMSRAQRGHWLPPDSQ
ncbi:uncharacterized protein N7459_001527 [Penicillium hispanicum]|uniref:uncharacterized protein n=1 Tax=Penicillium hispanicum TaxID=1080232 RepID=UPI00253FA835|nr:uncharacterized protein N7459_001527 [Penicillium hispanicum]KAJ5595319.1 hypothetical protein N7459_001527 [Penicillium hispanicum]